MRGMTTALILWLTILGPGCGGQATTPDSGSDAGVDAGSDGGQTVDVSVTGTVVDSDGVPVPGARVEINSDPIVARTDATGGFSVQVPAGTHHLAVSKYENTFHQSTIDIPQQDSYDLGTIEPTDEYHYNRLVIRKNGYVDWRFDLQNFWALVTVEDLAGMPIAGLKLDKFAVTEAMQEKASGQSLAEQTIDLPAQIADDWTEAGLFERSLGPEKLDIMVIMDGTSSMDDYVQGVIDELHGLVDLLQAGHYDFRMAGMVTSATPDGMFKFPFYDGNSERDRLLADIDYWFIRTGGEWWNPSTNYDAILASPWYQFRPDARKVVLVITDIVPGTIYGTFWYTVSCTNASASAVELFAGQEGVEIYYSQNPAPHPNAGGYCDSDMNPRACEGGNPKWGIPGSGLGDLSWPGGGAAVKLDWPFGGADFYQKLVGEDQPLDDSRYLLSWESTFDMGNPVSLSGHEDEYQVAVTLAVQDPKIPGQLLSNTFQAPINVPTYNLTFGMRNEEGSIPTPADLRANLYYDIDGRLFERNSSLMGDENGQVLVEKVPAGHYRLQFQDTGRHGYAVQQLRALSQLEFDMPQSDFTLDPVRVTTGEHLSDKYKLLGLLDDLDDWRLSGDPFARFADDTRLWLEQLEKSGGGLSWQEMIAIKRLIVAISGYANLSEYAEFESMLAVDDFKNMIDQIAAVIDQIKRLKSGIDLDWKQQIAAGMLKVLYAVLSEGRINALIDMVQEGINHLITYAGGLAFDETIDLVLDKFDELGAPEQAGAYVKILVKLLKNIQSGDAASKRAALWEAAEQLGLRVALDTTGALLKDRVDKAFDKLDLDSPLYRALKALIKEVIDAALAPNGFADFDKRLESWAEKVGAMFLDYGRDDIVAAVENVFDDLNQALEGRIPKIGRDFFLGFLRDMALANIPIVKHNQVVHKFNRDMVIESLVRHALYNIVLKKLYVDEMQNGLNAALVEARRYAALGPAPGTDRDDWEHDMDTAFYDYRGLVGPMQQEAWDALALQDDLHEWALGLDGLTQILEPLSYALDTVAYIYPSLTQTAQNVHTLITVLDTIQVVATAIQFGIKIKCLKTFGSQAKHMYQAAF